MAKTKKSFTEGYKTYDPKKEGYGNPNKWKSSFYSKMNMNEAKAFIKDNDPLSILGLNRCSTLDDLKKAFRLLILIHHPDKNAGNEKEATEKTQQLIAAYTILKYRLEKLKK